MWQTESDWLHSHSMTLSANFQKGFATYGLACDARPIVVAT